MTNVLPIVLVPTTPPLTSSGISIGKPGTVLALGSLPFYEDWHTQVEISLAQNGFVKVNLDQKPISWTGQRPLVGMTVANLITDLKVDAKAGVFRGREFPLVIVGGTAHADEELQRIGTKKEAEISTWGSVVGQQDSLILADGQHRREAAIKAGITYWYCKIINKGKCYFYINNI